MKQRLTLKSDDTARAFIASIEAAREKLANRNAYGWRLLEHVREKRQRQGGA